MLLLVLCWCTAGHIRIIPLLQHRMLLVAFKQSPSVRVSLSLSAPLFKTALSPGDLGQLNFIQGLIGSAIKGNNECMLSSPSEASVGACSVVPTCCYVHTVIIHPSRLVC